MGSVSEDQKKRTLDALESRFAFAKAELLQQQQKKMKKTVLLEDGKTTLKSDALSASNSSSFTRKGNFSSANQKTSQADKEEDGLAYSELSQPIHENLLTTNEKFTGKRGSVVDKVLHVLLQSGDSAQKYLHGSRSFKIDNWILLDNYVHTRGGSTNSQMMASRSKSKRAKHMSMKQLKKCGVLDLPAPLQKFDKFVQMHDMWKSYMMQLVKTTGRNQLAQCILGADLHGAIVVVADCRIRSFIGVGGIMIRETAETFGIITREDKLRVVPKKASVFVFQVDCWKISLLGDKLVSRNSGTKSSS